MDFPELENTPIVPLLHEHIVELWKKVKLLKPTNNMDVIQPISNDLRFILCVLQNRLSWNFQTIESAICKNILKIMFCFLAHVRDIHKGLGHRMLYYSFLNVYYDFYPEFVFSTFQHVLVHNQSFSFGSWRDICGLCNFLKNHSKKKIDHPLILQCIQFMNEILHRDWKHYMLTGSVLTNVAKWTPREKSKKNEWLFTLAVLDWSRKHTPYWNQTKNSYVGALLKSKTKYRKMVSTLNKLIDPVEIKLCAKQNPFIHPLYVSNGSLMKHWDSLFNQTPHFEYKQSEPNYNICALNLAHFFKHQHNMFFNNPSLSSSRCLFFPDHLDKYVALAFRCIRKIEEFNEDTPNCPKLSEEINVLNDRWKYIFNKWNTHKFIGNTELPIIDIDACSLDDPSLHKAIAHACFIAQSSGTNRILYSAHSPIWINIDAPNGFLSMIRKIYLALHNHVLINTSLESTMQFLKQLLGKKHTIVPVIVTENGDCKYHSDKYDYSDFFYIMDSPRYEIMQHIFDKSNIFSSNNRLVYANL